MSSEAYNQARLRREMALSSGPFPLFAGRYC
jgi:hypothetical protein